jgi:hypothetical protein
MTRLSRAGHDAHRHRLGRTCEGPSDEARQGLMQIFHAMEDYLP